MTITAALINNQQQASSASITNQAPIAGLTLDQLNGAALSLSGLNVNGNTQLGATSVTSMTNSGTLGVTGTTTLGTANVTTLGVSGTSTLGTTSVTSMTNSGTLGVTGATTLGTANVTTLGVSGTSTLGTANVTTLGVSGTTTLGATSVTSMTNSGALGVTGIVTVSDSTNASNKDTGALVVANGGVGIEQDVRVGGSIYAGQLLRCDSSTDSTTKDNGALVVTNGGLGVEKSISAGATIRAANSEITSTSATGTTSSVSNTSATFTGTLAEWKSSKATATDFRFVTAKANDVEVFSIRGDGQLRSSCTTPSTDAVSGSIIADAGIGVTGSVNIDQANNQPVLKVSHTDGSFTDTALQVNCARTSSSAYNLMDLRNNTSTSVFRVRGDGKLIAKTAYAEQLGVIVGDSNTSYFIEDQIRFGNSGTVNTFYVMNGSSVGVLLNNGSQSWAAQSDRRIKTGITPLKYGLKEIEALKPVTYQLKQDDGKTNHLGFVAQDVLRVLPELVKGDMTDIESEIDLQKDYKKILSLETTSMIPVLVKALQELKAEVEELKRATLIQPSSSKKRKLG